MGVRPRHVQGQRVILRVLGFLGWGGGGKKSGGVVGEKWGVYSIKSVVS